MVAQKNSRSTAMIPAQSTRDDATTNARVRRADQRGSAGAGSDRGAEIGKGEAVTDGSSGVCGSADRKAVSLPVSGPCLFKVRQTANAKHSDMAMILPFAREIRRSSPTGRPKDGVAADRQRTA